MKIEDYFVMFCYGESYFIKKKSVFKVAALSAQDAADEIRDALRDKHPYFSVIDVSRDCRGEWE